LSNNTISYDNISVTNSEYINFVIKDIKPVSQPLHKKAETVKYSHISQYTLLQYICTVATFQKNHLVVEKKNYLIR